jgi:hypothetical protein
MMRPLRNAERIRLDLQNRLAAVHRRYANAGQQVEKYCRTILPDAKETLDLVAVGWVQIEGLLLSDSLSASSSQEEGRN